MENLSSNNIVKVQATNNYNKYNISQKQIKQKNFFICNKCGEIIPKSTFAICYAGEYYHETCFQTIALALLNATKIKICENGDFIRVSIPISIPQNSVDDIGEKLNGKNFDGFA